MHMLTASASLPRHAGEARVVSVMSTGVLFKMYNCEIEKLWFSTTGEWSSL